MAARPAGGGVTPERVVKLLKDEVAKTSQAATARATGLTLRGVQNYLKGIGEPTTATLQKLADYFRVSVEYLRGEDDDLERRDQIIDKIEALTSEEMLRTVVLSLFSEDKGLVAKKLAREVGFTDEEANIFVNRIGKSFGKHLLPNILDEMHLELFKPLIDMMFKVKIDETMVGKKELEAVCTEIGSKLDTDILKPVIKELALMPASELPGIAAIIKRFRENQSFNLEARKLLNNSIAYSK